ncbi:hypothetical protein TNCV_4347611 [Trichonephila clavipes]|nr:hypothetical protein TNCV_4347611 [Trichonephila clavipes]
MDFSPPTPTAFMVSGFPTPPVFWTSPIFGIQSLSSTIQVSFFQGSSLKFSPTRALLSSPKKNPLKHQRWVHNAPLVPSHSQATKVSSYPQDSLVSYLCGTHKYTTNKGARILIQHLDKLVHHTPLLRKAIILTSANATVSFLYRLHLLSMGAGSLLTIMTVSLGVVACLSETFLRSGVNEKFTQFCVTVEKVNGSCLLPYSPSRRYGDRIASWEEKGEAGTPRDLRHIHEKVE